MQSITQRLAAYEQERRETDATLRDHYGLQHKPWPWEEPLPEIRLSADTLVTLADSIKLAVAQRRLLSTQQAAREDRCVEVRVNTREEAEQLRQLLPQDVRSLVSIYVSEDDNVDLEQLAAV
jgi:hypothetical protein